MEQQQQQEQQQIDRETLEKRPGFIVIGSPNVGKRTLLSRLLSADFGDASDSSSPVLLQGWTINTKYYTADVSVWMAHLHEGFSISSLPNFNRLAALVMVFDMGDLSSLVALKEWVSHADIQNFDILLCIGNKVDLLPGHPAHVEYRRHLQSLGDSFVNREVDFADYGISETEGSSLLGDDEPSWEIRKSCLEWCTEHNIEYIEACASNNDFDKCLSVDGDSQGVERIFGALSAHMWPGMILKSGNKITAPILPERQESELSQDESDYEIEYERLPQGSSELWDDDGEEEWVSVNAPISSDQGPLPSTSMVFKHEENGGEMLDETHEINDRYEKDQGRNFELEELEQLMAEIGNARESLRLMPDFQRREMAAKLAVRMAEMFGDSSSDDGGAD
ncbi:hypothetical protein Nepgr_032118 [Nepenthes gracilis]|uniref:Uncharacterized protein n=1 Tax=Nepenthes gracilis TaxID=150966 RepID=A0AAD3TI13_NEPGR|nr:hypothetical protein Nepgr_032118 [Nepenthes gracilis]